MIPRFKTNISLCPKTMSVQSSSYHFVQKHLLMPCETVKVGWAALVPISCRWGEFPAGGENKEKKY